MKVYQLLSWLVNREDWTAAKKVVKEHMPSGSGVDNGTSLDLARSRPDRLIFATSFHHMTEHGMYDGWTEHEVIVIPLYCAMEFSIRVTGRNRNDIKEYLHELFRDALEAEVP